MIRTITVLLASLVIAPFWTFFEFIVRSTFASCTRRNDGGEVNPKIASAGTTASSHLIQLVMWWVMVVVGGFSPWVFDISGWSVAMVPRPQDLVEQGMLMPVYAVYFGFAWHSLVKDLRRSWGNLKSPDQLSFLLHHVIAVGLVSGAFHVGGWRAGVLTRLIHDPADIFLYASKFYQGLCDEGRGRFSVLAFLYILNCVVWFSTRVLGYGYFTSISLFGTLSLTLNEPSMDRLTIYIIVALYAGSWIMLLLQVLWLGALLTATRKFFRTKGKDLKDHLDKGQPEARKDK